ncbi:MAG TPA: hypothetical protein GXZ89_07780 [Fastidiosipila sp.]|nr:hypothetical protein [Fastidiosipila sp.]
MILIYQTGALILAILLDLLIGRPDLPWHLDFLLDKLTAVSDRQFYPEYPGQKTLYRHGIYLFLFVVGVPVLFFAGLLLELYRFLPIAAFIVEGIILWQTIDLRNMTRRAMVVAQDLELSDQFAARLHVSFISDRETGTMDEQTIVSESIRYVAASSLEYVIGPLFYFFFAGTAGSAGYRSLHVLKSRVDQPDDRYIVYGQFTRLMYHAFTFLPRQFNTYLLKVMSRLVDKHDRNIFQDGNQAASGTDIRIAVQAARLAAISAIAISLLLKAVFVIALFRG